MMVYERTFHRRQAAIDEQRRHTMQGRDYAASG